MTKNASEITKRHPSTGVAAKQDLSQGVAREASPAPVTLALLVFLSAMAIYLPSLRHELLTLDDPQYVTRNSYVLYPTWEKLGWVFTEMYRPSTVYGYYQPLTMASLMLDRVIEGRIAGGYRPIVDPFVYHFTNILLHGLNASLVFLIVWLLARQKLVAVFCGLFFAFHPLNVEVVAWVSQRKALLATFFALAMVLSHLRAARTGHSAWHVATGFAFLASVLSKPTGIFLPLVLLLVDVWPLRRFSRKAVEEKLPLFVLAIVFGWIAYMSQTLAVDKGHFPPGVTLLVVAHNLVFYLAKFILPIRLCPIYIMPEESAVVLRSWPFLAGMLGSLALLLGWITALRRRVDPVWTLLAAFLLLIGSTLTPVRFMGAIAADRFVYTPMIALIVLLAEAWRARLAGTVNPVDAARRMRRTAAVGAIILALFAVQTHRQQAVWQTSLTHSAAVVARFPESSEAHYGIANAWLDRYHRLAVADDADSEAKAEEALGRAIESYRLALKYGPDFSNAYYRLGHVLILRGYLQEGIEVIQRGLNLPGADAYGLFFLGLAYTHLGEYEKAIEPYEICLDHQPSWIEVRKNLANALLRTGRAAESLPHYQRLYELNPTDLDGIQNWSVALLTIGRAEEAIEKLRQVVVLRERILASTVEAGASSRDAAASSLADAQFTLAGALAMVGAEHEALSHLDAAATLKPELIDQAAQHPAFAPLIESSGWGMLLERHGRLPPDGADEVAP